MRGDSGPPVTTSCLDTELAVSSPRWKPRITVSNGSMLRAAARPATTGRAALVKSMDIVSVPGLRPPTGESTETMGDPASSAPEASRP